MKTTVKERSRKKLIFSRFLLLSFAFSAPSFAHSQQQFIGWQAGLNFSFGTHVNRIGIMGAGHFVYEFAQVNTSINVLHNFQSLGLKKKTPEIQAGFGAQFGFANRDIANRNRFIGLTENNTSHNCAIGYSYQYYWDKNETSQGTGAIGFDIYDFSLVAENDIFAGGKGWRDRFRTGGFYLEYQYDSLKFGLGTTFWTGDYVGCDVVKDDPNYPTRWGYRTGEKAKYGKTTMGLLYASVKYLTYFNQVPQLRVGIDSEKVRNALQNKLIHNAPFAPDFLMKREVYHIPMLMENGEQFLHKKGQTVRPPKFYFNFGLNEILFY